MEKYFRFSTLSIVTTYLLIFFGGLVRVSGAGMGCPDWPKCFGRWIPPTNINQVPEIYIEKFNIVLAWVEYINRLFGAVVGLVILLSCFFAYLYFKKNKHIYIPILMALILTIVEGWLGSMLVHTVLDPITITLHLLLALIIIGLIIYSSIRAYIVIKGNFELNSNYPQRIKWLIFSLITCMVIEIIIGTEIRGALDMSRKDNPLIEGAILLNMLGSFKYAHTILGILLISITYYLRKILINLKLSCSRLMLFSVNSMFVIFFLQILSGEFLVFFDVKPVIQLFHMWFSSLLIGLGVVQYTCFKISKI